MEPASIFLSYSRTDEPVVEQIAADLGSFGLDVWRDQRLSGGQEWWDTILAAIRAADVFVVAVSDASLESVPCARELGYAAALGKPVLPVRVDPGTSPEFAPPELARREWLDYSPDDKRSALGLLTAVRSVPAPAPAPEPLPPPPAVPLSYTTGLAAQVATDRDLSPVEQRSLLVELRDGLLDVPPGSPDAAEYRRLLQRLRARRELLASVGDGIDEALGEPLGAPAAGPPPPGPPPPGPPPPPAGSAAPPIPWWRRPVVVAAAAGALLLVAVGAVLLLGRGGPPVAYGDDVHLDGLQDACEAGDPQACDALWAESPADSDYEAVGLSCGGALPDGGNGDCVAHRDALLDACAEGDFAACDGAYAVTPAGSDEEEVASTCGHRTDALDGGCAAHLDGLRESCGSGDLASCDTLFVVSPAGSDDERLAATCGGLEVDDARAGECAAAQTRAVTP